MPGDMARPRGGNGAARAVASAAQLDLEADALGIAPNNLPVPVDTKNARLPVNYQAATHALAECARVDEAKEWVNKAEAIAAYARMADDDTLYKTAGRIKARAVDRCGQLLKQFKTGPEGGRPKGNGGGAPTVSQAQAARAAGLSKDQEVTAVRVSNVPRDVFEQMVESEDPPTVTKLAEIGKAAKRKRGPKKEKPVQVPARPNHLSHLYLWIRAGGDLVRKFSSAAEAVSLASQHNVHLNDLDTSLKAATEFLVELCEAHECGSPAQPPTQLVDELLGACFTWKQNHPEATDRDVLGALREVSRLVQSGALSPETEEVWEKWGGLGDGRRVLILSPSDHAGFTYVTVIDNTSGEVTGLTRPLRDDAIEEIVSQFWNASMPTRWHHTRSTKHRENPHLIGSEPLATKEQREQLLGLEAEANRRLDEFGYQGPRSSFVEGADS
jgi:hypothetical protein